MVLEGLRGYLQLANGLTDVTRARARATARSLVAQGEAGVGAVVPGPVREQVAGLTEDLIATSRANRDLLIGLIRAEVERSVARLGLVSAAELESATARAQRLEDRVHELERELRAGARPATGASGPTTEKSTAKKAAARKSTAKKATARKSTAKKATARKSTATKTAAGEAGA